MDSNHYSAVDGVHCQVCASIDNVNRAFQKHRLQLFHEEPDPHVSVAWLLGNHYQALSEHISKGYGQLRHSSL
ncbi:TPA: hypothetical protein ACH3X1_009338 [Trebouxia sp. C0004]